ncbi:hypothetical protein FZ041_00315 [Selenomonas caprae]|uniref:Flagellin n=2 Tax=Selenomonas caprae TaxID=2606905 RepID=A0A5D6WUU1_9FIRM|nr:hypothetical protein FZ041_00315 [Selenomonas caprae]
MIINNNSASMMTLGELNKNISKGAKQLKKLALGERITGAGDDASGYSISERMRVRIRALDQDEQNVQNGQALLNVAEGAIQSQIELMKTIKQKVIDADNDTNTDVDRATIQKEINHAYQQIEDIAQETNYNGVRLLVGDHVEETVRSWVLKSNSSLLEGSDAMNMINVIPNVYPTLNGITGPFDLFQPAKIEQTTLDSVGFSPAISFTGGTDHLFTFDSSYNTVDSLDGTSLMIGGGVFVLTKTPSSTHEYGGRIESSAIYIPPGNRTEIDISVCQSIQDVLAAIKAKSGYNVDYGVDANGANYLTASQDIRGVQLIGATATVTTASPTGLFSSPSYFSGGTNPSGGNAQDPDSAPPQPGTKATFSLNGVVADTGITIERDNYKYMLRFVAGNSAAVQSTPPNGVTSVGVDYSGSFRFGAFDATISNGQLTLEVRMAGKDGNRYKVTDGIEGKTYEYLSTTAINGTSSRKDAYATVDVSGYTDVDALINDFKGKAIMYSRDVYYAQYPHFNYSSINKYDCFEFIDSGSSDPVYSMYKINKDRILDLDNLRTSVANGKSIGDAFAELFTEKLKSNAYYNGRVIKATDNSGQTVGVSFKAIIDGKTGNNEKLFLAQGQLRSYTLDYGKWFTENPNLSIPDFLNNKGFRAYCASCDNQVFNFHFITDDLPEGPRPEADPGGEDIKHIYINVSNVTDASSLVQAIVDQATPELTGSDPDLNHFMRLIADGDKLIIYDERRISDDDLRYGTDRNGNLLYEYQWDDTYNVGGAKIADGVWDNVEIGERKIYAKDLIIHHTDHASMNIHLKIPQTTLDHLFGYEPGSQDWSEFNVMTSKSREELLGNRAGTTRSGKHISKDEEGLLDRALNYLIGANCLVGAQNMRLKMTEENIVSQREGTVASESTIRDANMAKEMTGYTKANVLAQASQSMLAQANQNSSGVLRLLQ